MINCIIVDDEPYAIDLLCKHIVAYKNMNIVSKCRNVKEAITILHSNNIDLMFLDVRMPDISGIEFLQSVTHRPKVILTTAYREYAIEAYENGVFDYLLKPISFMRFAKAINRYVAEYNIPKDKNVLSIVLKSGSEYHKIELDTIEYIKSAKEYVSVVCDNTKCLIRSSMSDILEQLPMGQFIQVHKSYIVPVKKIQSVSTSELTMQNSEKIPIGRSFLDDVRSVFST